MKGSGPPRTRHVSFRVSGGTAALFSVLGIFFEPLSVGIISSVVPEDGPRKASNRVAFTKKELQSAIAIDLIALCETMTADGRITDEEVAGFRQWLQDNRSADLPAIGFLIMTVEQILADGQITDEERRELYKAVERVLPPETRQKAKLARIDAEGKDRRAADLRRPTLNIDLIVVGTRYEGRDQVIADHARVGDRVYLVREPSNPYDRNAVKVLCSNGMQIGYIPREHASYLAPVLDAGCKQRIEIVKFFSGRVAIMPVVRGGLYRVEADVEGSYLASDAPNPDQASVQSIRKTEFSIPKEYKAHRRRSGHVPVQSGDDVDAAPQPTGRYAAVGLGCVLLGFALLLLIGLALLSRG